MATIEAIKFGPAEGDDVEVTLTLRGDVTNIVKVLVSGLPREALEQIREAMGAELAKRRAEAQS